jgi:hypothetical protein
MNPTRSARMAELVYVALVLGGAAVLWREAGKLPPAPYDPLGPGSFPRWVAAALAALGAVMALKLILGVRLGDAAVSMVAQSNGAHRRSPWTAAATMALAFGYAILLSTRQVPFVAATGLYLFAAGAVLGPPTPRRLGVLAVVAAAAAIVLDLTFRRLFRLDL